jgi:hypothetical protein
VTEFNKLTLTRLSVVITKSLSMCRLCITIGWWTKNVNPIYVSFFWKLLDSMEWVLPVQNSEDSFRSGKRKKSAINLLKPSGNFTYDQV